MSSYGSKAASGLRPDIDRCVSRAVARRDVKKLRSVERALRLRIADVRAWKALAQSFEQDRAKVLAEIARLERRATARKPA